MSKKNPKIYASGKVIVVVLDTWMGCLSSKENEAVGILLESFHQVLFSGWHRLEPAEDRLLLRSPCRPSPQVQQEAFSVTNSPVVQLFTFVSTAALVSRGWRGVGGL